MKIQFLKDGPILLHLRETNATVALCRCGLSGGKPLCDGSHKGKFEAVARECKVSEIGLEFEE